MATIPPNAKFQIYTPQQRARLDGSGRQIPIVPKTYTAADIAEYVEASGLVGKRWARVSITDDYAASDHELVLVDSTKKSITVTLPTLSDNLWVTIKKTDSSANTVMVTAESSGLIDGSDTVEISTQYDSIDFCCDETNWFIR